jgi:hypothetical protein
MTPLARPASVAIQILRLPQVRARTGLCRTMIYQLEAAHQFSPSSQNWRPGGGVDRRRGGGVANATRRTQPQRTRPVRVNLGAQGLPREFASPRFKRRAHLPHIPVAVVDRRHAPIGVSQQALDQGLTADA